MQIGTDKFYLCGKADWKAFAGLQTVDSVALEKERCAAPQYDSSVSNGTAFSKAFRRLNCAALQPSRNLELSAILDCDMVSILTDRSIVNPHIRSGELLSIMTGFSFPSSTSIYPISRKHSSIIF